MIQEIYENEWSSATIMTLTNDYRQVERFAIEMGMEREEKEKWNRNTSA